MSYYKVGYGNGDDAEQSRRLHAFSFNLRKKRSDNYSTAEPPFSTAEPTGEPDRIENGEYEFVSREQFAGLPARGQIDPLELPIRRVLIGHTVTEICLNFVRIFLCLSDQFY